MNGYVNMRCDRCGLALFFMPRDVWPPQWQECWNEACPNKGKPQEPTIMELKPKAQT